MSPPATLYVGDAVEVLRTLPSESVQCCVTSPPYWGLRDYGTEGQLGLERTPDEYVANLVNVFREVRRMLSDDGTLWLNLGDSYVGANNTATGGNENFGSQPGRVGIRTMPKACWAGLATKNLVGIPWRVAFALQADGWYLRSDIIWSKPNPMPESVRDRPTKAHEYVFLLSKSQRYYYDADAIAEGFADERMGNPGLYVSGMRGRALEVKRKDTERIGMGWNQDRAITTRNARTVWEIATKPFTGWTKIAHRIHVELGDADDDTTRTGSPDCPVHGDSAALAASLACGERVADGKNHTQRNGVDLGREYPDAPVPTDQIHGAGCGGGNSDSSHHGCADSATPHSNGSHRTDRAPETTEPCSVSAESPHHTGRSEASLENAGPSDHTPENSNGLVGSDDPLSAQRIDRIADSISRGDLRCTCLYHKVIYKDTSHFATFPPELAERCIKAGSKPGDTVLDPFGGSGTTAAVATGMGRSAIHIDLNPNYLQLALGRIGPLLCDHKEWRAA